MPLPVLIQHQARTRLTAYCARRIPAESRDRVRLKFEIADNHVTLTESRPHFRDPGKWISLPVARFSFNAASGTWTLHSPAHGKPDAWHPYPAPPSRDLERMIGLLDADEDGSFWG
jgi:hypothetical protein